MHRNFLHAPCPKKCRSDASDTPWINGKKTRPAARIPIPKSWHKASACHGLWVLPQKGHPHSHTQPPMTGHCPFLLAWTIALANGSASAVPGLACACPMPPPSPNEAKAKQRQGHTHEQFLCVNPQLDALLWHEEPIDIRGKALVGPPGPKPMPWPRRKKNIFRLALAFGCF